MWVCPLCNHSFSRENQYHSCNDRTLESFLERRKPDIVELFYYFIDQYKQIGDFEVHPAKTQIGLGAKIRFGYIPRVGKEFIDVALTLPRKYADNLCFHRIGEVPGIEIYQHYLRLMHKDDINDEVKKYMKLALDYGNKEFNDW
ncbi:MAG: DUF5655 domain-containing protein [Imperialibacter sp.]